MPRKPVDDLLRTYKKSSPAGAITQKKKTESGDVLPVFDSDILDKATVNEQIQEIELKKEKNSIYTDPNYKVDDKTKYVEDFSKNNPTVKKRFDDFSNVISKLGFELTYPFITDNSGTGVIAYYAKVFDSNGTPFYVDLKTTHQDLIINPNLLELNMVRVVDDTDKNNIDFLVFSGKEDIMVECGDGRSFCVVKNDDNGKYIYEQYKIPSATELTSIKNDIEATQVPKRKNLLDDTPIGYRIVDISELLAYKDETKGDQFANFKKEILAKNLGTYNDNLKMAFNISMNKMEDTVKELKFLDQAITSFKINREKAIKNIESKRNTLVGQVKNSPGVKDQIKSVNKTLESFIKYTNDFNKMKVQMFNIKKNIIEANNQIVTNYQKVM